ncbi:MAG TPA: extracellular solute-binding protein, partial [Chthonomonadaceae bacterium]|nr:extracellular solute-binding protein [Chthonomonadaceae bacterium]
MSRATRLVTIAAVAALVGLAASHAGILRNLAFHKPPGKRRVLRVWDWWSPSTQEKYTAYFASVKRAFERRHPDVEVIYQFVPFGQYEQKMTTALVGESPPDVFQSSVYWAEGFYDRGALLPLNRFLDRDRARRQRQAAEGLPGDSGEIVAAQAFLPSAWRHNVKPDGT